MNEDRGHGAMPKLYGAPAYARPPAAPVVPVERPFDPDDLPIEAERTGEEQELASTVATSGEPAAAPTKAPAGGHDASKLLRIRSFRTRPNDQSDNRDQSGKKAG